MSVVLCPHSETLYNPEIEKKQNAFWDASQICIPVKENVCRQLKPPTKQLQDSWQAETGTSEFVVTKLIPVIILFNQKQNEFTLFNFTKVVTMCYRTGLLIISKASVVQPRHWTAINLRTPFIHGVTFEPINLKHPENEHNQSCYSSLYVRYSLCISWLPKCVCG